MTAIETDGLSKRYGDVTAVENLNLVVEEGEVFGFLGSNGAGKSTTINVLLGFLTPSGGRATVLGHDATTESPVVRSRVGLLPEGFDVYENLSGRHHVVSAIQTKGSDDDPDDILDRVGLAPEDARRPAGDYSKGMIQRVALGIALVGDPDLLVLDEPSSGLDPQGIKRLRNIVREESDRGATVFFSSHVLGQVEQVCDRVGIMDDGELVAVDAIDELREETGTSAVVEVRVTEIPDRTAVRNVEGVQNVTVTGDAVRATCARPATKMAVLRRLDELTTVRDGAIDEASLESLFDEYTRASDATTNEATANDAVAVSDGGRG